MDDSTPQNNTARPASTNLELLRTSSLTGALEGELEYLILNGELKPGERLNEIKLSTRFGVSRGPLREATRSLSARGLVDIIRNRGVFVRAIAVDEALEIYDLRAAFFGLAGRLLIDLVTDDMLTKLNDFLSRMDAAAECRDFDAYYPINLAFHDYLISAAGNATLIKEYHGLVNKLHLCRAKGLVQAGGLAVSNREHREMVDGLASGDKLRAQEAFFRHVERSRRRFETAVAEDSKPSTESD
jgi:DNA-binding GntR family transcriptional regulator